MRPTSLPGRIVRRVRRALAPTPQLPSAAALEGLMERYRTENLQGLDPREFRSKIEAFLTLEDAAMEGLEDPHQQRDLTVRFHWGHDHDFGSFELAGQMGRRHIRHLAEFIDVFGALPRSLEGKKVLDIGCWTGGTSLLLHAMGAEVVAVDEVRKYVDCLSYLQEAFGLGRLVVLHRSLYDLAADEEFQDAFDFVLFAGVLYHVTDPIVALRITFNCLRDGGRCLLETTGFRHRQPRISYARRRWNWFDLSPAALEQMMSDVGYGDLEIGGVTRNDRLYAVGRRARHVAMRRDGLSRKDLR